MGIARAIRKEAAEKADIAIEILTESAEVKAEKQKDPIAPPCRCS
jgi:hypothetical protein